MGDFAIYMVAFAGLAIAVAMNIHVRNMGGEDW